MHIAIYMPLRFLMGKMHEWGEEFDWGVVELGEALDCWYDAMVHLKEKPEDYLNKDYMLGIFASIKPKLRPFEEYLDFMFEEKMTVSVGGKDALMSKIRDELFDPKLEANKQSTEFLLKFVPVVVERGIKEMTDENKGKSSFLRYAALN